MSEKKIYNSMEKHLQLVSGTYISAPQKVKRKNNVILHNVLNVLINKMKQKDARFKELYKRLFFGGSYYEGLKVGTPDEYDVDLLFNFPSTYDIEIRTGTLPGFVNLYLQNKTGFENLYGVDGTWKLYLDTDKMLCWMESVIQKAFNNFVKINDRDGEWYILAKQHVRFCKTDGPAFTLTVKGVNDGKNMNIDLVPCILFNEDKWPQGFNKHKQPGKKIPSEFFAVPKHPKRIAHQDQSKFWRLSFQIQERCLIHNKGRLKPALKLLKKLRDVQQQEKLYSYFLKTVVLRELLNPDESLWLRYSLSYIFMHILNKCQQCIQKGEIKYFWNDKFNLLETVQVDLNNMSNRLRYIIDSINRNISENPEVILQYILTPNELKKIQV